jgi:hypothetical protein
MSSHPSSCKCQEYVHKQELNTNTKQHLCLLLLFNYKVFWQLKYSKHMPVNAVLLFHWYYFHVKAPYNLLVTQRVSEFG